MARLLNMALLKPFLLDPSSGNDVARFAGPLRAGDYPNTEAMYLQDVIDKMTPDEQRSFMAYAAKQPAVT
jgi:hypothetical protein